MLKTPLFPALSRPDLLETRSLIDGKWLAPTGATIAVTNPATGAVLAHVGDFGAAEAKAAIASAERALPDWRARPAQARAAILRRFADLMREHQQDLAQIMTAEQGKPLTEASGEIAYAASFLEWFGEEARRIYGETIPAPQSDRRLIVIRQPVGVVAAITPWNFPAAMITRKLGPALAAGCTMILKPSDLTPLSALALAKLGQEAGIPGGVFNVITGQPAAIGGEMTGNPSVRKLTFTGSTNVGKLLLAQCAATVKRVSMELGGNAPFIVFDSANLNQAIDGVIASKFRNAGQTCVCANRILVQAGVYDSFARRLAERIDRMIVGDSLNGGNDIGPLINQAALAKVEAHIEDARAKGAMVMTGGRRHPAGDLFFEPTLLVNANDSMRVFREETFGPVAPLFRFETEEQAIAMANDTRAGLAAYVYTGSLNQYYHVSEALEYGMVGVNTGVISTEVAPFGGVKESGMGREGSRHGIDDYLDFKTVTVGGL